MEDNQAVPRAELTVQRRAALGRSRCSEDVAQALEDEECVGVSAHALLPPDSLCRQDWAAEAANGCTSSSQAESLTTPESGDSASAVDDAVWLALTPLDFGAIVAQRCAETLQQDAGKASLLQPGAIVVDVCMPYEYSSDASAKRQWGWARVRQALFRACMAGELLILDERTLFSLQGNRERMRGYVAAEIRRLRA
ncbi:hypothetical protein GPECTOR_108g171 [Gonium pectorale]|uniref:Uncharacterized protein n=1 Tax=Gonium pectorale TaxID=33097 RepID=A0A150FZD8_GONPE|nr:hypothetical protein GPECTOR_108g171 [Gonium pectorale]|eukprot:KXZ42976.1 hypothetical protein GPECTOR_108g171 [Gonium pectorale]